MKSALQLFLIIIYTCVVIGVSLLLMALIAVATIKAFLFILSLL